MTGSIQVRAYGERGTVCFIKKNTKKKKKNPGHTGADNCCGGGAWWVWEATYITGYFQRGSPRSAYDYLTAEFAAVWSEDGGGKTQRGGGGSR